MFFVGLSLLAVLAHLYLAKRLVVDTTRSRRVRRAGFVALGVLALLAVASLLLPRRLSLQVGRVVAWPGYLWLAVLVYLTLALLVLEVPRLVLLRRSRTPMLEATATSGTADVE